LKATRERLRLTLADIAASTKIRESLFAALERNDLSAWPIGLFRRAMLRDYLRVIGLPADPIVAEFVRLFPEPSVGGSWVPRHDRDRGARGGRHSPSAAALRLALAGPRRAHPAVVRTRVYAVGVEFGLVLLAGGIVAVIADATLLTAAGLVALCYYPIAGVLLTANDRAARLECLFRRAWTAARPRILASGARVWDGCKRIRHVAATRVRGRGHTGSERP
jgi:hypothetical protein